MKKLYVDFETYSPVPLSRYGSYTYSRHPDAQILLLAYGTNKDNLRYWEPQRTGYQVPPALRKYLDNSQDYLFTAHNARFEQHCWSNILTKRYGIPFPEHWECTQARARMSGLPASLEECGKSLKIEDMKQAHRGKDLINLFCKPRRATRKNPRTEPDNWDTCPGEWAEFIEYCLQDVRAEIDIDGLLPPFDPVNRMAWIADTEINLRGLPVGLPSVDRALAYSQYWGDAVQAAFCALTDGIRPTQRDKVLEILKGLDAPIETMQAAELRDALACCDLDDKARELIELRIAASFASVRKLDTIRTCSDRETSTINGCYVFFGAHTGRWSSKYVQMQNIKRGDPKVQKQVFKFLSSKADVDTADIFFDCPMAALSLSMRGFIAAHPGKELMVVDYAQIEARVLAWLADEFGLLNAFSQGVDPYKKLASRIYSVPLEKVNKDQRQIGKSAILGCGFGLWSTTFIEYVRKATGIEITEDFSKKVILEYRDENKEIVKLWKRVEKAFAHCVMTEKRCRVGRLSFVFERKNDEVYWVKAGLPSGRYVWYYRPRAEMYINEWGKEAYVLSFHTAKRGRPFRENTYGGKLVENIVQATARDILVQGMDNARRAGFALVGCNHDEIITHNPIGFSSVDELAELVCDLPTCYEGLPMKAEGFVTDRYTK